MIGIVRLWEELMQSAKTGTSGYQSEEEFNRDVNTVQRPTLMGILAPYYESNQTVADILAPFVEEVALSTTKPADYFRFISATNNGEPCIPINANQATMYSSSSVRSPAASGNTYYYFQEDGIVFLSNGATSGTMKYLRYPEEAEITLTPTSTADSDYLTPTSVDDLEWPEQAYNLILYFMMQKLGLEMKEPLLAEFANLGIQFSIDQIQ